jgi:hypothetical protein
MKILSPEELNELIELAEDGYKLHVSNGSHNEFLREDKDILRKAKEYLKQMTEQPEENNVCERCKNKEAIYHYCGKCLIETFELKRPDLTATQRKKII